MRRAAGGHKFARSTRFATGLPPLVKDLGDWATYKLQEGFRTRRRRRTPKQRREVLSESRMREICTSGSMSGIFAVHAMGYLHDGRSHHARRRNPGPDLPPDARWRGARYGLPRQSPDCSLCRRNEHGCTGGNHAEMERST